MMLFVEVGVNNLFIFSVSALTVFQSWFFSIPSLCWIAPKIAVKCKFFFPSPKFSALVFLSCVKKNELSKMFANHMYLIYLYKEDLALNNLQWLICYKTQPNHTWNEAMHNMSSYQLPQYYQPQQVSSMASTALVTWYTCYKVAHNKILLNFWLFSILCLNLV